MKHPIIKIALYTILIAIITTFTFSCIFSETKTKDVPLKDGYFEYKDGTWSSMVYKIEEKTIDSCQYIIIFGSEGRNIIHKANCKNTQHIYDRLNEIGQKFIVISGKDYVERTQEVFNKISEFLKSI